MKRAWLKKRASAYLAAIGVLSVLCIAGFAISRLTGSGRWATLFSSSAKYAEDCAESASNLTFKVVKDSMNDYSSFWQFFKKPKELLNSWFMYFRLPTPMAEAYLDPVNFEGAKANGVDVQLDLFNNGLFKPLYEKGITYVYDTITPDNTSPLSPLKDMFTAHGGRVRAVSTARIKSAFGILASGKNYVVGGVEVPLRRVTGFMANLFDKIKIKGHPVVSGSDADPTGESGSGRPKPNIDILNMLPDDPLLKAPDISDIKIIVQGTPVPIGAVLQEPLNAIFKKVVSSLGLTPKKIAKNIFGSALEFNIDFEGITKRIEDAIHNCLPEFLQAFAGNVSYGVTIEKQGIFEVTTEVEYYPKGSDKCIKKKLVSQREFRVADIQPIASDYSFFVANSKLLYEDSLENDDNWQGDDQINFNKGSGAFIVHNMPSLKSFFETFKSFFSFKLEKMARNIQLPGLVRINGTKEMLIKLTMFKEWPSSGKALDLFKRMEIAALLLPHKSGSGYEKTACATKHGGNEASHNIIPGLKSVMYNFWDKGKPFDWPYFGGGEPGGNGSFWLPIPPANMASTLLFGNFHIEFPFSMRVEGYLKKVYSHIRLLLVKIFIPPIPIIGFMGLDIPIPWFWANAVKEPYGFCSFPPYKSDEEASTAFNPNEAGNLPANTYSPTQYLKKASYFYKSSREFEADIENRTIDYDGKKVFVCDGVSFINDSLWLENDLCVMGRGILVAAGNVHLKGNITKIDKDKGGNTTLFSIVARSGAIINHTSNEVHACLFGDKGLMVKIGSSLKIYGNLCLNRFNRADIQGDVDIYYQSNHCRSSLLSMIRPIAKYDPTRYYVTLSSKTSYFNFEKIKWNPKKPLL